MRISRRGSERDHGETVLADEDCTPVLEASGLKFRIGWVPHRSKMQKHHNTVEPSRDELLQAVGQMLDQLLVQGGLVMRSSTGLWRDCMHSRSGLTVLKSC